MTDGENQTRKPVTYISGPEGDPGVPAVAPHVERIAEEHNVTFYVKTTPDVADRLSIVDAVLPDQTVDALRELAERFNVVIDVQPGDGF